MKPLIKKFIQCFNKLTGFWCAKDELIALKKYRLHELENVFKEFEINQSKKKNILDFGFGDGFQAHFLKKKNFNISAVDIKKKKDIEEKGINFLVYDGKKIPFENNTFDIIFSSSVLEHLNNLDDLQEEFCRVLNDDGICIHILPSSSWRFWTIVTSIIKYWYFDLRPHGEIVNNSFMELIYFSRNFWKKNFKKNNFEIIKIFSNKLFYTGNNLFGLKINLKSRIFLSKFFGSSCNVFVIKKIISKNHTNV